MKHNRPTGQCPRPRPGRVSEVPQPLCAWPAAPPLAHRHPPHIPRGRTSGNRVCLGVPACDAPACAFVPVALFSSGHGPRARGGAASHCTPPRCLSPGPGKREVQGPPPFWEGRFLRACAACAVAGTSLRPRAWGWGGTPTEWQANSDPPVQLDRIAKPPRRALKGSVPHRHVRECGMVQATGMG